MSGRDFSGRWPIRRSTGSSGSWKNRAFGRGNEGSPARIQPPEYNVTKQTGEAAFETVIEAHLLDNGYVPLPGDGFDRERAIFPGAALGFIRETQPREWARLEALHGSQTGEQVLSDLCKWLDAEGALATLRHGFKCYGRTLRIAFFRAAHELNPELEARYAANRLGLTRQPSILAPVGAVARRPR